MLLHFIFAIAQVPQNQISKPPAATTVLAKVDGAPITASEVEPLLWDWRGHEVLEDLITYRLILAESHRLKLDVPEIEVLKVMDDQLKAMKTNLPKGKDLNQALREQGFPSSRLYLSVKSDLMLQAIAEKQFDPKAFVKVSTMVFPVKSASADDLTAALKAATDASDRLAKGEKWEDVLKATQSSTALVGANGLLGWRQLSAFPEPARGELSIVKVGEVTKPVQTQGGIQIFRLEASGSTLKGSELDELRGLYMPSAKQQVLQRLRDKAKILRLWK